MENQNYHGSISTQIAPKEAFDKIARVSEWWATNFQGKSRNLNDIFTVRFGDTFVTFKIVEAVPDKKVVWQVTDSYLSWLNDKTEWNGTQIVWEISSHNHATQVEMTHVGLVPGIECYDDCKVGWDSYIEKSLSKFLAENKGRPDEF